MPDSSATRDSISSDLDEAVQRRTSERQTRIRLRKAETTWVQETQEVVVNTTTLTWPLDSQDFEQLWQRASLKQVADYGSYQTTDDGIAQPMADNDIRSGQSSTPEASFTEPITPTFDMTVAEEQGDKKEDVDNVDQER